MAEESFILTQQIFKAQHSPVHVDVFHENNLTAIAFDAFLQTTTNNVVGIAPSYGPKSAIGAIALSSATHVLVVKLSKSGNQPQKIRKQAAFPTRIFLRDLILCNSKMTKYTFQMDKLATALHFDLNLRINQAVDLLSAKKPLTDRHSLAALLEVLGGEPNLNKIQLLSLFKDEEALHAPTRIMATQAWVAYQAAHLGCTFKRLATIVRINTNAISQAHLDILAKTVRDANRLTALKPMRVKNEVDSTFARNKDNLELISNRFKTRVMRTAPHQVIEIQTSCKGKVTTVVGQSKRINGRSATIALKSPVLPGGKISSVTTIGREALTSAEAMREDVVLKSLQQTTTVMKTPFVQGVFIPQEKPVWTNVQTLPPPVPIKFPSTRNLNRSQVKAVNTILSNKDTTRIALIHGPPGTGKTTVIAAAVTSIMAQPSERTIWLVAQSNVAVKNIAEKLATVDFLDFKILVSKDFHFDWHEHLYQKISKNLIRSDDFVPDLVATERMILGSRVILCTLSMISNHKLGAFARLVPPQTVIFDEASQIEIGDYFPLIYRFHHTIQKLVFIGDDKQLAPYGQSDINDLRSVFEMPHLRKDAVFLDTQYRMPVPIGDFISRHIYKNKLKSEHPNQAPTTCLFVNVLNGKEEKKGHSWMNFREISTALALARKFHKYGKSYRIITAYDGQRSQLENALKASQIPWEDRCFNVDSFQGNEDDYIILSLVRSEKLGFMKELRRMNVMLTRCKKGMIILTNRGFIEGKASSSLVGLLAKTLGPKAWVESPNVPRNDFYPFPTHT